jgi:hypothetical protein
MIAVFVFSVLGLGPSRSYFFLKCVYHTIKHSLGLYAIILKCGVVGIIKTYMRHRFLYVPCVDGAGRVAVPGGLYFYGLPEARARSTETALVPAGAITSAWPLA